MFSRGDRIADQCPDRSDLVWALDPETIDECLVSAALPDDEPETGNGALTEAGKAMEIIDKIPARDRDGAGLDLGLLRRQASLGQPFDWQGINGILQAISAGTLSFAADNAYRQILKLQIEHPTLPINMSGLLGKSPEQLVSARRLIHAFGQLDTRLDLEMQRGALERVLAQVNARAATASAPARLVEMVRALDKALAQEPTLRAFRDSNTFQMRIGRYLVDGEWNPTAVRGGLGFSQQGPISGRQLTEALICFRMLNELPDHQLATGEIACVAVARAYAGVLVEPRKDGPDLVASFRPVELKDTPVVPQAVREVVNQAGPVPLAARSCNPSMVMVPNMVLAQAPARVADSPRQIHCAKL